MPRLTALAHVIPMQPAPQVQQQEASNWDLPNNPTNIPDLVRLAQMSNLEQNFRFNLTQEAIAQHGYQLPSGVYEVALVDDFPENNRPLRKLENMIF